MKTAITLPLISWLLLATALLNGCAGMSDTQQRTVSGAGMGAIAGAVVAKDAVEGAVIGAGVGALSGYIYDQHKKSKGE